jgi:hypothetical protein
VTAVRALDAPMTDGGRILTSATISYSAAPTVKRFARWCLPAEVKGEPER